MRTHSDPQALDTQNGGINNLTMEMPEMPEMPEVENDEGVVLWLQFGTLDPLYPICDSIDSICDSISDSISGSISDSDDISGSISDSIDSISDSIDSICDSDDISGSEEEERIQAFINDEFNGEFITMSAQDYHALESTA